MRQAPQNLIELLRPVIENLDYELVGVEFLPQGSYSLLRIYIDSSNGVTISDCERVSHQVSGLLDVEDAVRGRYTLEVSSPGLDRPLFSEEHFRRFVGETVKVRLSAPIDGRKNFTGIIRGLNDGIVELEVESEKVEIPFSSIEKANLVPNIK